MATQIGLVPGNAHGNARWLWLLNFIDPLTGPSGMGTIGTELRNAIATACNDQYCQSIEFFAVPDTNVSLHLSNIGIGGGNYSRIITLFTATVDQLGGPP